MKLTKEDIYKYGTREEIEFLTEMLINPFMEFITLKKKFMDGPGSQPEKLTPEEKWAKDIVEQFKTLKDLTNWFNNPEKQDEIKKVIEIFKKKLNQIYQGAFAFAKK